MPGLSVTINQNLTQPANQTLRSSLKYCLFIEKRKPLSTRKTNVTCSDGVQVTTTDSETAPI